MENYRSRFAHDAASVVAIVDSARVHCIVLRYCIDYSILYYNSSFSETEDHMWNDAHPDFLWFRRFITMALGFFSVRVTVIPVSRFHGTQIQYLLYEYELPYDPRLSIFTVDRPDDTHITLIIHNQIPICSDERYKHMKRTVFYVLQTVYCSRPLTIHIRNNYQTSNSDRYATMRHHMRFS